MKEITWKKVDPKTVQSMFCALNKHIKNFDYTEEKFFNFTNEPKTVSGSHSIFQIYIDRDIVGFCAFRPGFAIPNSVCYLSYLYVKEEFRNQGIGTQIIRNLPKMFEQVYHRKMEILYLNYSYQNEQAAKFYKRFELKPCSVEGFITFD